MAIVYSLHSSFLIILACCYFYTTANIIKRGFEAMKSPLPGPKLAKWTTWWMRWHELNARGAQTIYNLHRQYGPVVQTGPNEISFSHVDALRDIYKGPRGLDGSAELAILRQYGSENLVSTVDADVHARRRRQVAGLYSGSSVADPVFQSNLKIYMDRFMNAIEEDASTSPSRTVNVFSWIKWLTSDIMVHLVFGEIYSRDLLRDESSRKELQELMTRSPLGMDDGVGMLTLLFPKTALWIQTNLLSQPAINVFGMNCVKEELNKEASTSSNSAPTHLQKLLSIYNKDGLSATVPNITYIASDCVDHFFAGSSTTTDLTSAIIWRLSMPQNKPHQGRLRKELRDAGTSAETAPDLPSVQQLPFLSYVIRESLRVDPPIPFSLPRIVKEGQDVEVMGLKIEAGTEISAHVYSLHRDPNAFDDPETWNPDRWSLPTTSPTYKKMMRSMMAFGTGGRMCTGMNVAWAETRLLIARIYSTYETRLDESWLDEYGALLPESARKGLYPNTVEEPIEFWKLP